MTQAVENREPTRARESNFDGNVERLQRDWRGITPGVTEAQQKQALGELLEAMFRQPSTP